MISQKYSYIRKYLFIFSILFLFFGCDIVDEIFGGGEEDSNLSNQQEQALTIVLTLQDDASDIMDNLFSSGFDTLTVIDSLYIFFLNDTYVQNVWADSEGVAVEYNNGISGGIFIGRYNSSISSIARLSNSVNDLPTGRNTLDKAINNSFSPEEKTSIYFDGAYSQFKEYNDQIISTANNSFSQIGMAPFVTYLDNEANIEVLSTLDQYGIVHLTGHGWHRYSGTGFFKDKKESYLLTGEEPTFNKTYGELWSEILDKNVVIVSHKKQNRYWVSSKFVSDRNNFTDKNVFIYDGFCYGFRENWQNELVQNAGAAVLVGYYWAVWSNFEMEWAKKMYTSMCDTSLNDPMKIGTCISDITKGNRGYYDVGDLYDPFIIKMKSTGDQDYTFWEKEILNGSIRFMLDHVVTDRRDTGYIEEVLHFNGLNGLFSNNRYIGSYWYESLGRTFSGTVEITFIDNPESINFHLNGQYTYQSLFGFGTVTFRYTVDYDGIPYKGLEGEYVKYHVYSENGSTVQKINVSWSETNSQYTENLISWDCGDGAYIRVEVDKRE